MFCAVRYYVSVAGYSETPLPKKLGIRAGARVALVDAPPDFHEVLGVIPENVSFVEPEEGNIDVAVCFSQSRAQLEERFLELKRKLAWTGGLWIAWHKNAVGVTPGLVENTVRDIGLAAGLVDNKVCAIDETWSGLRFVWRVEDRPKTGRS
jgi:hypothetical protein